jgi:predicted permease
MLIFRVLLLLFPRAFRTRYGADLIRALTDRRREARRLGVWPLIACDAAAAFDLIRSATLELLRSARIALTAIAQDARFAIRMLRRRPALSFFSAATFALGIGTVTTIASLADALLVQPLPYPHADQLVAIRGIVGGRPAGLSYPNLRDIAAQSTLLSGVSPFFAQSVNLTGIAEPDRLRGGFVTSEFFAVLGVAPASGSTFGREADVPSGARLAVLTDRTWKTRFNQRPDIVGQQVRLNNSPFTIVGVMPASFRFPIDDVEVFLPFWTTTAGIDRGNHNYLGIARLMPSASLVPASQEVASAAASLERTFPQVNAGRGATVESFRDLVVGDAALSLRLFGVMGAIMLVAACANVAGLHLGDAGRRSHEIAVRAALGAGGVRIARQLLIESIARAAVGAAAGLVAAAVAVSFVSSRAPADVYGIENATIGRFSLVAAAAAALLAGLGAGLPPALQWARGHAAGVSSGNRSTADAVTSRLRNALVATQVALAALLVVAAGLTTRSLAQLASMEVGFDPGGLLTMEYRLPVNRYASTEAQAQFHRQVLERIRSLPGIVAAAGVRAMPFSGNGSTTAVRLATHTPPMQVSINAVSDDYFVTMRIPLLAGRAFQRSEGAAPLLVVSRTFADLAWPGENAIGKSVYFEAVDLTASVIGVVGDVRHRDLAHADPGSIYTFADQNPSLFNTLVVRTAIAPMSAADDVRRAVWSVDPDQPVWKIRALDVLIEGSIAARVFIVQLVGFFGLSAAALAVLGLYGVVASSAARRTREIGVRVALGASNRRVLALILWGGLRLGAAGIGAGLAAAALAANVLRTFLFGISAHDPVTFAAAAALLFAAAGAACLVPSVRALRLDPVDALRSE